MLSSNPRSRRTTSTATIEGLESRTLLSSTPATVILTVPGSAPASAVAGAKVNDKIAVNIANNDVVKASGKANITLFLSTDQTLSSDDVQVTSTPAHVGLNVGAGKNHTYQLHVKAFPSNLNGSYFIIAQIVGNGVNTTAGASAGSFAVGQANIDLSNSILKAPSKGHAGKKISVVLNITNNGNITAKEKLTVGFSLSTASDGSNATAPLDLVKPINIKPGSTQKVTFSVLLPVGTPTGNNYIVADVDPNNANNDSNLLNNTVVDLQPIVIT